MKRIITFLAFAVICGTMLYGQSDQTGPLPAPAQSGAPEIILLRGNYDAGQDMLTLSWPLSSAFYGVDAYMVCRQNLDLTGAPTGPVYIDAMVTGTQSYIYIDPAPGYYFIYAITYNPSALTAQSNGYRFLGTHIKL